MTDNEWKLFETNLLKKYDLDPSAELAEVLIKEYSAHMINQTDCTKKLQLYIEDILAKSSNDNIHLSEALGLNGKWGRSKTELKYIFMNAQTWQYIFERKPLSIAYQKTAQILSTSIDEVRIGFERKNHDFGTRELSRFGLDIFIALNKRQLSSEEITIADEYLKEDIRVQMSKDLNHHRIKYKFTC
tara:strand:+ start:164 stop:724 length:561 start_codon:yes stop_codon:yes gene_type:complete